MRKVIMTDVLKSPEIVRYTKEVLALRKREKEATEKLGTIAADIGDKLIAVKKKLDASDDKTAWERWLTEHVDYHPNTARNYMRLSRLRTKNPQTFVDFLHLDVSCLYRIASLPDHHARKLKPDTKLTDPRTGQTKPLKDMSARELDRALDTLEGKRNGGEKTIDTHRGQASIDEEPVIGTTREDFAAAARRAIDHLTRQVPGDAVRKLPGHLQPSSKQSALKSVEALRRAILGWPVWAVSSRKHRNSTDSEK